MNQDGTVWSEFRRNGEEYLIRFPGFADFEISSAGESVRCWPTGLASETTLEHLWLNQVQPLAISRQGQLILHGSAVLLNGSCAAFLGHSGRGKSTLAASFAASGAPFLTDDGLYLFAKHGELYASPGHPSIRLWPRAHEALLGDRGLRTSRAQHSDKIRTLADAGLVHCSEPQRLRDVFFLGPGEASEVEISLAKPSEGMVELMRHSFLLDLSERAVLARHFDELAAAAQHVTFHRLDYPRRFDVLESVKLALGKLLAHP